MEIFLDTADLDQIKAWLGYRAIDGVTTNPSIMLKKGIFDLEAGAKEIARVMDQLPVSVEVTSNDPEEMLDQAREISQWALNIVVKIPIINENGRPCLDVIGTLEDEGIRVNVTACLSYGQAILAAKVGATYVSIFAGRVSDEGHDASKLIRMVRDWIDDWGYKAKIIVGSIREVINIQDAAVAGAHVITVPPEFMHKLVDHKLSRATVQAFVEDGQKALAMMIEQMVSKQ